VAFEAVTVVSNKIVDHGRVQHFREATTFRMVAGLLCLSVDIICILTNAVFFCYKNKVFPDKCILWVLAISLLKNKNK